MNAALSELVWTRPWGFAALVLPALLLLLARYARRPPELATGALAIWSALAADGARGAATRPSVPPRTWLLALALLLGALALAGPRAAPPESARTWTLLVDRSPSTRLALAPPDGATGEVGAEAATRGARALALALEWLRGELAPGDRAVWVSPGLADVELAPPLAGLPSEWTASPDFARAAPDPDWFAHDRPGALWITDRGPAREPAHAGLFASGGAARPGPVGLDGATWLVWNGDALVEQPAERRARLGVGDGLGPPLARLAEVWAEVRGVELTRSPGAGADLELVGPSPAERASGVARTTSAGRDGWSLRGTAVELAPAPREEPWLADSAGRALVRASSGRVRTAWTSLDEPSGDAAAFAVSWSALLDRALVLPGVVPLAERADAGRERVLPGSPPSAASAGARAGRGDGAEWSAWLAFAAALAVLAALGPRAPERARWRYSGSGSGSSTVP